MASLPVSELERLQAVHLEGLQQTQRAMTRALREQNQVGGKQSDKRIESATRTPGYGCPVVGVSIRIESATRTLWLESA